MNTRPQETWLKPMLPLEYLGSRLRTSFAYLGALTRFTGHFFKATTQRGHDWTEFRVQCEYIGLASLPIAVITLLFVGFVFAFQFGITLETMGAVQYIGNVVGLSIVRELGPVFTALVVGGRVGAGMAAELGSMKVTEQIDAIRALGASPYKKLLMPRVLAALVMIPLVSLLATLVGIFGALIISWLEFNVGILAFYKSAISSIYMTDFISGFLKPFFFAFGIAVIGCYEGFSCQTGTVGVGKATTRAVVNVSLMIVFVDFFLTRFFAIFPRM